MKVLKKITPVSVLAAMNPGELYSAVGLAERFRIGKHSMRETLQALARVGHLEVIKGQQNRLYFQRPAPSNIAGPMVKRWDTKPYKYDQTMRRSLERAKEIREHPSKFI